MRIVETLPPSRRASPTTNWYDVCEFARAHPDQWIEVGEFSNSMATQIKHGNLPAFYAPMGAEREDARKFIEEHWEITTRSVPAEDKKRRALIYVRWIG